MDESKRKINLCFIFSLIVEFANIVMLVYDISKGTSTFWIVFDVIYLVSGIVTIIGFAIFNSKPISYALKHKRLFIVIVCFSCVSSLILAFISLTALYELYANSKVKIVEDNTIETSGKIVPTAEELATKIKVIDEMKNNGSISQAEYQKLKQEILDEIIK